MKKIILATVLLASTSTFTACSSDDNSSEKVQTVSDFKGNWSGTFSGNDAGTWTATIDANGQLIGQVNSQAASSVFVIKGNVNDLGVLDADFYSNDSVIGSFDGVLTSTTGQGTWNNMIVNFTGTWQGTKN